MDYVSKCVCTRARARERERVMDFCHFYDKKICMSFKMQISLKYITFIQNNFSKCGECSKMRGI